LRLHISAIWLDVSDHADIWMMCKNEPHGHVRVTIRGSLFLRDPTVK